MAIFLMSGGLDSTTLAAWVMRHPYMFGLNSDEHVAVHFRIPTYPAHEAMEESVRRFCTEEQVELVVMTLDYWAHDLKPPDDFNPPVAEIVKPKDDPHWLGYLDGRGILMLTHASILARQRDMNTMFVGYQSEYERLNVPDADLMIRDNSEEFLDIFTSLADESGGFLPSRSPEILAPYLKMGVAKSSIYQLALDLEVDVDGTQSCKFSRPGCGKCSSCRLRERALNSISEGRI